MKLVYFFSPYLFYRRTRCGLGGHGHRDGHCCGDGVRGELPKTYFGIRLDESAKHARGVCDGFFFLFLFSFSPFSFVTIVFSKRRQTCTTQMCVRPLKSCHSFSYRSALTVKREGIMAVLRKINICVFSLHYWPHYYRFARVNWQQ